LSSSETARRRIALALLLAATACASPMHDDYASQAAHHGHTAVASDAREPVRFPPML